MERLNKPNLSFSHIENVTKLLNKWNSEDPFSSQRTILCVSMCVQDAFSVSNFFDEVIGLESVVVTSDAHHKCRACITADIVTIGFLIVLQTNIFIYL